MTSAGAPSGRRLLGVFAHPDDETFGIGGTLALYARRGVETHVVCATRGEVGEAPDDLKGFATKAEMRTGELECAARILGLTSVRYLGYRDSGMPGSEHNTHAEATAATPLADVARKIAWHIRDIRPQVIVTFDPIGGYRHPDHIAVHQSTLEAFRMAGDPAEIDRRTAALRAPEAVLHHLFARRTAICRPADEGVPARPDAVWRKPRCRPRLARRGGFPDPRRHRHSSGRRYQSRGRGVP